MAAKRKRTPAEQKQLELWLAKSLKNKKTSWVRSVKKKDGVLVAEVAVPENWARRGKAGRKPVGYDERIGCVPKGFEPVKKLFLLDQRQVNALERWRKRNGHRSMTAAVRALIDENCK
jgi:hypothetical protein